MAPLRCLVALLAFLTLATLAAQPQGRQRGSLTVYHDPGNEASAALVLDAASAALPVLESALGLSYQRAADRPRIRFELVRSQRDFEALAGRRHKPWIQGLALSGQRRVILKNLTPAPLRTVTVHELTHILLDELAVELRADPPRWLHEGLAKFAASDFSEPDRQVLGEAVVQRRLLTVAQLERAFAGTRDQVELAYAQSYTLVEYLHDLQPGGGLRQFLGELSLTGEVDRALLRTYGHTQSDLERRWHHRIRERYLTRGLPFLSEGIILLLMGGLFLIVHTLNTRRRRRIRERLQEEDTLRRMFQMDDSARPDS